MYGDVELRYRGKNPALFGFTGLGAGLGAVTGFSKGGLLGAFLGMLAGGTIGLIAGYLFEVITEELLKAYSRAMTRQSCTRTYYYTA